MRSLIACLLLASAATARRFIRQPVEQLATDTRLHQVRNFATDAEMDHIIDKAFLNCKPQNHKAETGMMTELGVDDPILADVYNRMRSVMPGLGYKPRYPSNLTRVNPALMHDPQWVPSMRVRRYLADGVGTKGGDLHPEHSDYFERHDKQNVLLISVMLYLSTPEVGGQTNFHEANGGAGIRYTAKRGNLAVWWSCTADGRNDLASLHSGSPVGKGIKWNAVHFIYDHVGKCPESAADFVYVPEEVLANVPQADSTADTLHNISLPPNVVLTPEGAKLSTVDESKLRPEDVFAYLPEYGSSHYEDGKGVVRAQFREGYKYDDPMHRFIPPPGAARSALGGAAVLVINGSSLRIFYSPFSIFISRSSVVERPRIIASTPLVRRHGRRLADLRPSCPPFPHGRPPRRRRGPPGPRTAAQGGRTHQSATVPGGSAPPPRAPRHMKRSTGSSPSCVRGP